MGIIIRQSVQQSLLTFIGTFTGLLATFFVYNRALETYGLAGYLMDSAMLLSGFLFWGIVGCYLRFYPHLEEPNGQHKAQGLQTMIIILALLFGTISAILLYQYGWDLANALQKAGLLDLFKRQEVTKFSFWIIPLAFIMAISSLLSEFMMVARRTAIQGFFDLYIKLALPILIVLLIFGKLDNLILVKCIIFTHVLVVLSQIYFLSKIKAWDLKWNSSIFSKSFLMSIFTFAAFHIIGGIGAQLALRMDSLLISSMLGFGSNGEFKIANNIINVMQIPMGAILSISAPIISSAMSAKNYNEVGTIYRKSALNMFIMGAFIYTGTLICFDELLLIIKNGSQLTHAKEVVILLGAARLIDLITGVNDPIINYSSYFKYSIVFIVVLGLLNYSLNLLLIPMYGIIGCAMATFIALTIYNLSKAIFIYYKFKIQPFDKNMVFIGVTCLSFLILCKVLGIIGNPFLSIALKCVLFSAIYIVLIMKTNIAPDMKQTALTIFKKGTELLKLKKL